jgi:DNA topoisomerase VI subunit B
MIGRAVGQSIRLETSIQAGLWAARIDSAQLESAVLNLVFNSRDAMPESGTLLVEASNVRLDADYAARQAEVREGEYVAVCVSDTGTGMPQSVIAKAFDPFFTTKPIGQGTGLGLSMIYGFLKQVGGHVKIDSEIGRGTRVRLYLPRDTSGEDSAPLTQSQFDRLEATGETILLVEDDNDLRVVQGQILGELGYEHIEAEDAKAALPLLQSGRPIDLLITDVGLPG